MVKLKDMENTMELKDKKVTLTLSNGVIQVGDIKLEDGSSLILPEGVTQVGHIDLYNDSSLILPEGVTQVGHIDLYNDSSLILPEGVTQVGDIWLSDSSLILPEGVMQVGEIDLHDSASLTLPAGVKQVGEIDLHDSASLTLPAGVKQVGDIYLRDSASLTLSEGVTQVGRLMLGQGASITCPDGYVLENSSYDLLYSSEEMNQLLSEHQKFLENEKQTIDPEVVQGQRFFVVYPEDVLEGRPLPLSVEGCLTNDGKAYVSFSGTNRIIPEDGLIMVKNPHCNNYDAFNRKTFDLLYRINPDGTASRKKQSMTMKPGMRKKSLLKK